MTHPDKENLPPGHGSARALERKDFRPIATHGWGDPCNSYAHSMAWFGNKVYVGSARANLHLIRGRNPPPRWLCYPVETPPDPFELDLRAEIRRYDLENSKWKKVHQSPTIKRKDGTSVPREIGIRGMAVFKGRSDDARALYVSTFSPTRGPGPMILRSEDGESFSPVAKPGLGYESISAFRTLVAFNGKLYTSPIGSTRNRPNLCPYPIVLESVDPARGIWRPVSVPGFGNRNNAAVFEMVVFQDFLYATTFNCVTGFEVWKTKGEGRPPYKWTRVIDLGAHRGCFNEGGLSLCVFNDSLYVGTGIQDGGYDRANGLGPAAAEVIRLYPDDSWEIVVGNSRLTPSGLKIPVSPLAAGFDNFFNGYIWRMCVHDGWLYAGTFDWSVFLPYAPLDRWPPLLRTLVERTGVQNIVEREGGFDLWRTQNGTTWSPVTHTGFDNKYNCGLRTMVSTPSGLFVGTANPFGPKVGVRSKNGWKYFPNPRGGLEIWLGASRANSRPTSSKR